jgi:hypothetical protein
MLDNKELINIGDLRKTLTQLLQLKLAFLPQRSREKPRQRLQQQKTA